jgi:hypothetical protein
VEVAVERGDVDQPGEGYWAVEYCLLHDYYTVEIKTGTRDSPPTRRVEALHMQKRPSP